MRVRARALFCKHVDDTRPALVEAVDEGLWEHRSREEDEERVTELKLSWPGDYEWREAWVQIEVDDLVDTFLAPTLTATATGDPVATEEVSS